MKNLAFVLIVLVGLFSSSCKKDSPASSSHQWTIKNVTYPQSSCQVVGSNQLVAVSGNGTSTLQCNFLSIPTSSATYYVSDLNSVSSNRVGFVLSGSNGDSYVSTGGNGTTTVNVSVSSGKISLSTSNVEMVAPGGDSTAMNINIGQ